MGLVNGQRIFSSFYTAGELAERQKGFRARLGRLRPRILGSLVNYPGWQGHLGRAHFAATPR
jgi:hypothetical protein